MNVSEAPTWRARLLYLAFALAGIALVFRPTLGSGFARMQAERGDTVFTNLVLEHQFRSLFRPGYHAPYATLPIFDPARGTLYYSETLIGTLPVYALLRVACSPFIAFQLWSIAMLAASYAAMVFLLRRLEVQPLLSALGGYVFAFGMARGAHLYQQHLLPAWCAPLALAAWVSLRRRPNRAAFASLLACLVWQLFCAIQLGWFLHFGIAVLILVDLAVNRDVLRSLLEFMRTHWRFVCLGVCCFAVVLTAIVWPFIKTFGEVGWRNSGDLTGLLPRPSSWLQVPRDAYLSRLLPTVFHDTSVEFWEHELFPGFIPVILLLLAFVNLHLGKNPKHERPSLVRTCLIACAVLVVLSLYVRVPMSSDGILIRHGGFSVWWLVYDFVPGACGIRAAARIWTVVHLFALVGGFCWLGWWLRVRPAGRLRKVALAALAGVIIGEQITAPPSFEKKLFLEEVARMRRALPQSCKAAYFVLPAGRPHWVSHNLAAWAGLAANIPVVNGYSSNYPVGYPNGNSTASEDEIRAWTASRGGPNVCYVTNW